MVVVDVIDAVVVVVVVVPEEERVHTQVGCVGQDLSSAVKSRVRREISGGKGGKRRLQMGEERKERMFGIRAPLGEEKRLGARSARVGLRGGKIHWHWREKGRRARQVGRKQEGKNKSGRGASEEAKCWKTRETIAQSWPGRDGATLARSYCKYLPEVQRAGFNLCSLGAVR